MYEKGDIVRFTNSLKDVEYYMVNEYYDLSIDQDGSGMFLELVMILPVIKSTVVKIAKADELTIVASYKSEKYNHIVEKIKKDRKLLEEDEDDNYKLDIDVYPPEEDDDELYYEDDLYTSEDVEITFYDKNDDSEVFKIMGNVGGIRRVSHDDISKASVRQRADRNAEKNLSDPIRDAIKIISSNEGERRISKCVENLDLQLNLLQSAIVAKDDKLIEVYKDNLKEIRRELMELEYYKLNDAIKTCSCPACRNL